MEASLKSCIRFVHHNLHKPLYRLLTVHVWPNGSDPEPRISVVLFSLCGALHLYTCNNSELAEEEKVEGEGGGRRAGLAAGTEPIVTP